MFPNQHRSRPFLSKLAPTHSVSICGAGHSGSTLLGLVLDGHADVFYMGEGAKARYLHDERKILRKRVCKICGEGCPVWSTFEWNRDDPLYPQVARHVGRQLIVDSTKDPEWIRARTKELQASDSRARSTLLFLVRDGRAVINSRIRKYPDRDPEKQIRDWMEQIDRSRRLYAEHQGPKLRLRYEEFATNPKASLRRICTLLDLEFSVDMLKFDRHPHHPLGGNNGTQYLAARSMIASSGQAFVSVGERSRSYYEEHGSGIQLDLRWKVEMNPKHQELFERVAGLANRSIRWAE
ncbi:MAG: sulfotransferase [Longimicrobiales bacterium]